MMFAAVLAGRPARRPPSNVTPSRPRSAPVHRRFDPTEYVQRKEAREVALAARLGRRPVTPRVSRAQSVLSSAASDASARGAQQQNAHLSSMQGQAASVVYVPCTQQPRLHN